METLLQEAFNASRSLNKGDGQILRKQLEKANDLPLNSLVSRGIEAHHVIPKELKNNALLRRLRFNIDSALNGIPLDNIYHTGSHPNYNEAWRRVLEKINASKKSIYQKEELLIAAIAKANKAILEGPGLRKTSSNTNNPALFTKRAFRVETIA
ncbi:hypothetical protein Pla100_56940 [Neorhodopirellula pilleata]|uniref:Uncharacterized protein n=2 Tax=Neorhodopirellula pilleata TaxID=2714738 RepID=A0A5C5ZPW2_9BACT|nr:hypothetical protein Pla100_56940 [Neorhodopirellula pilleata]